MRKYLRLPYSSDRVFGFLFLTLLTVSLVVVPAFNDPIETPKIILWSALLGLALIFLVRQETLATKFPKIILWLLGGFVVWSVVAAVVSYDNYNSLVGMVGRMTNSLWFFVVWVTWLLALSALAKEKFLFLLKSAVVIGGIIGLWAVLQNYGIGFYGGINGPARALVPSFLGNPNFTAMYLAAVIPAVFWLAWESGRPKSSIWVAIGAVQVWAMVLMASRGAILAVLAGLAVLAVLVIWKRSWKLAGVIAISFVILAGLSLGYLQSLSPERANVQTADLSANQRFYVWDHASRFIQSRPLTGSGLGNYFLAYRQNQSSYLANSTWFDDSHNIVLHLGATGGVPLALLFIAVIFVTLWKALFSYYRNPQLAMAALIAALVSLVFAAMFNPVSLVNWLLLGVLIVGIYQFIDQEQSIFHRKTALWLGTVLGGALVVIGACFLLSDVLLWQAQRASAKNNFSQAEYFSHIAAVINPSSTPAWSAYAYAARVSKDFSRAEEINEHLARLHPRSALTMQLVYTNYHALYKDTGNAEYRNKMLEFMKRYEAANANYFTTYQDLTFAYLAIDEYDLALQAARRHVVLNGKDSYPWTALARVHQARGDREQMFKALDHALEINPSPMLRNYVDWAKKQSDIKAHELPFQFPKL
jgi:O-antigen ligase